MHWEPIELVSGDADARRWQIMGPDGLMTWQEVLASWPASVEFVDFYSDLLAHASSDAFRWETPPLTSSHLDSIFEYVVVESNDLARRADASSFESHFGGEHLIVTFTNLGRDSVLVAPCPISENDDVAHFAAFLRTAPTVQIRSLWQAIADAVTDQVGQSPLWLSTAGAGVPWLHVRLDSRPKYYSYVPYRNVER